MSNNEKNNQKGQSHQAAQTRKENDPDAFSKMGQKGAEARHDKSPEEESHIAQKAAQTRKENDPDAFSKMGKKGGQEQHNKLPEEERPIAQDETRTKNDEPKR